MSPDERDALLLDLMRRVEALEAGRQRGPKTDRSMTEADAFRVKFGDLTAPRYNHKQAAAELGLSYGQVFSARNGYTFKQVKKDWRPKGGEGAP